jgi:hypothetical protein
MMSRRRITPFAVVVVALVLAGAAGAAATDPQIAIDPVDQSWSDSVVLHPADLGKGWRETPPSTQESESGTDEGVSFCPEGSPDQSDLVATGGSVSDFKRGSSSVTSFALVWRTPENAQADFDRTLATMPALQACTAGLLNASFSGIKLTVTANGVLPFPEIAPRTSAYRIKLVITSSSRAKKKPKPITVNFDTILIGNGRAVVWLLVTSYSTRPVSAAKVRALATTLAARLATDPAATQ